MKFFKIGTIALSISLLAACGGDDEKEPSYGQLKFYNASYNSSSVALTVLDGEEEEGDEGYLTTVSPYNMSPTYVADVNSYAFAGFHEQLNSDTVIDIFSSDFTINQNIMSLFVLDGEVTQSELRSFEINTNTLDDLISDDKEQSLTRFEWYTMNFSAMDQPLNVYYTLDDQGFSEATMLTQVGAKQLSERVILDEGSYTFYVTSSENDTIIYQSKHVQLYQSNRYIFSIRDRQDQPGLVLDQLSDQGSIIHHYSELSLPRVAFYQSNSLISAVDIYLGSVDDSPTVAALDSNMFSTPITSVVGDTTLSFTTADMPSAILFDSSVLNLEPNDNINVLFYIDEEESYHSVILNQKTEVSAYENYVSVVNMTQQEHDIDVYLVDPSTSINETPYHASSLDFAEQKILKTNQQQYRIVVTNVATSTSSDIFVLAESEMINFEKNANYTVVVNNSDTQSSGYSLTVTKK